MGDVVYLPGVTTLDIPVDRVLSGAQKTNLEEIVVIGYDKDDNFYFASSKTGGDVLWLLETAKKVLLEVGDE